jgi:1-acyl-sn-glycerol-3-phosphate acyltransferase
VTRWRRRASISNRAGRWRSSRRVTSARRRADNCLRGPAVRLAMLTGAPVIPVGIHYPREKNIRISSRITGGEQSDGYWYLTGPYQITVGEPIYFQGNVNDREQVEAASVLLMEQIAFLAEESRLRMHRLIPVPVPMD